MRMVAVLKFYAKGLWVDKHLGAWITVIMIMVHIGLGTAIITGGVERFSPPSYNPLVDFTFGNVWLWGVWIIFSAMLMSAPFRYLNILGLWLGVAWHMVWMSAFTIAALNYETAAATPIPAYGGFAMICTALLTARVIDKSEE
jgi:hypothetical protein